ncbi:MAG: glutathione S-transferase N-terminal domain-containing protein [Aquabacterium sp.]
MSEPLLFSFRRCPYAIRARLALHQAGIRCTVREVDLRHKPPELLALSPKGTVPVLRLPDGRVIEESLQIMQWALRQHDPAGWLTQAPADEVQRLIERNDQVFKPLLDRYKYPERHPEATQADWRDRAVAALLAELAQRLASSPCLWGPAPSLADMAILPFVRQFAQVDRPWWDDAMPAPLRQWLDSLTASALFQGVMAKP